MPANESSLLAEARCGNEAAFLEIYQRRRAPVFRFAWRLTGSVAVAEDVTQECFMALLDGAGFDARHGSLRVYLLGIARHLALKRLRHSGRETDELPEASDSADALADLLAAEQSAAVSKAVAALPPLQREALVLFEYEELSLDEIAAVAEVDVGAIKSRLFRAREALRRRLAPLLRPCGAERSCS